jgi:hypothetical protein
MFCRRRQFLSCLLLSTVISQAEASSPYIIDASFLIWWIGIAVAIGAVAGLLAKLARLEIWRGCAISGLLGFFALAGLTGLKSGVYGLALLFVLLPALLSQAGVHWLLLKLQKWDEDG